MTRQHNTIHQIGESMAGPDAQLKIKEDKGRMELMELEQEFHIEKGVENFKKFPLDEYKEFLENQGLTILETTVVFPEAIQ